LWASNEELAKHEPLVKDIIRLTNSMAEVIEDMAKDMAINPASGAKYVPKLEALTAELKTKGDQYGKLPKNVQNGLDARYKTQLEQAEARIKAAETKLKKK
jgi:hypothetical protein